MCVKYIERNRWYKNKFSLSKKKKKSHLFSFPKPLFSLPLFDDCKMYFVTKILENHEKGGLTACRLELSTTASLMAKPGWKSSILQSVTAVCPSRSPPHPNTAHTQPSTLFSSIPHWKKRSRALTRRLECWASSNTRIFSSSGLFASQKLEYNSMCLLKQPARKSWLFVKFLHPLRWCLAVHNKG